MVQTVQKLLEVPHVQFLDLVVVVPVVQRQRTRSWPRATDHGGTHEGDSVGVQFFVPGQPGRFFSPRSSTVLGDRGLWGWR